MDKKLKELQEVFAATQKKYMESKGYVDGVVAGSDDDDVFYQLLSNLSDRISYLADNFYNYTYTHAQGHLPPIKSVAQMKKALKVLGLEDEVNVLPTTTIYASQITRKGLEVSVNYTK